MCQVLKTVKMNFNYWPKCRKIMTNLVFVFLFGVLIILYNCLYLVKENRIIITSSKIIGIKRREIIDEVPNNGTGPSSKTSLSREGILEKTRSKIKTELQNYNLSYSGVKELKDLVMETGGNPLRSILVSTWRSGSTFLGELMSAMPGTFYNYEPFVHYGAKQIPIQHAEKNLKMLKSLLKCNYRNQDVKAYFKHREIDVVHFKHQTQLMEYCRHDLSLCHDPNFTENFCKLFPFLTIKLLRLRLRILKDIMQEKDLNVKLVLLIRDPRAVILSRIKLSTCDTQRDCWDPILVCSDMVSDHEVATKLVLQYPTRFAVIRYENLALNPKTTSRKLYEFLKLDAPPSLDEFINAHTNSTKKCSPFCTFKKSRDHAFNWKYHMDFELVNIIQSSCQEAMARWGYRKAHNATHMNSTQFHPLKPVIDIKTL